MEDTSNGHLEFSCLGLGDTSLEVRVLLDYMREHGEGITLTKVVVQVAGSLDQFHYIFLLDDFSKGYLIFAQFGQYSMCI